MESVGGTALVISMIGNREERETEDIDKLAVILGFDIRYLDNFSARNLQTRLNNLARTLGQNTDCFFCFVNAHGGTDSNGNDYIVDNGGVHKLLAFEDIVQPFLESPLLRGKPKGFFIKAQGSKEEEGAKRMHRTIDLLANRDDVLAVFSTDIGDVSCGKPDGAIFPKLLEKMMTICNDKHDLLSNISKFIHQLRNVGAVEEDNRDTKKLYWRKKIKDIIDEIDNIFLSNTDRMVWYNQCLVLKGFIDSTMQDLIRQHAKETKLEVDTASQLHCVLKRGLKLIHQCARPESQSSIEALIILGSKDEFLDIVDDLKRHCQMINNFILDVQNPDPSQNSDKEQLYQSFQKERMLYTVQNKLKADCVTAKKELGLSYEKDKEALIKKFSNTTRSRSLSRLIEILTLQKGVAFDIAESDLSNKELLGNGAFGIVYKARWCTDIPVAIKEFKVDEDFKVEYDLIMKLQLTGSSHIIQVLGHYKNESNSKMCLVMELMHMDLATLIYSKKGNSTGSPFSITESIDMMTQVAKGMNSLHTVKVIHRDLKPFNILVKYRNREKDLADDESLIIKLADFGVSKAEFQTEADHMHTAQTGTTLYMAPEMEDSPKIKDSRCKYSKTVDVYSFGLVCIEILTGRQIDLDIRKELKEGKMPSLAHDSHPELCEMIYDCLQLEPDRRPSFEQIVEKLWVSKERVFTSQSPITDTEI